MSSLIYGNLINRIMEQTSALPKVGDAATVCLYSDRHAGTVIEVDEKKQTFVVQRDKATRADKNGMSDAQ